MAMTNEFYEKLSERFREVFEAKWDPSELENFEELREKGVHDWDSFVDDEVPG